MGQAFTRAELQARGVSDTKLNTLLRKGSLERVVRGGYVTLPASDTERALVVAAVKPGIVYSGRTAADLWRRLPPRRPFEAVVQRGRGRAVSVKGVVEIREVRQVDFVELDDFCVTTVLRTAASLNDRWLAVELLEAHYRGKDGQQRLEEDLNTWKRVPARLRTLVDAACIGTDSKTEGKMIRALRREGLKVKASAVVGPYRFDAEVENARVLIEIDSYTYHGPTGEERNRRTFVIDRWKQNYAVALGYKVLRFSAECVDHHLPQLVEAVCAVVEGEVIPEHLETGAWRWHESITRAKRTTLAAYSWE